MTAGNKGEREWAAVSDRKIWTKPGGRKEADMEGWEERWKRRTRRTDWGQEVGTKGQTDQRQAPRQAVPLLSPPVLVPPGPLSQV